MKAEELTIGDWVRYDVGGIISGNHRIERISIYGGVLLENLDYGEIAVSELKPIPITPEILEKNGFEKMKSPSGWHEWVYSGFGKIDTNKEFDSILIRRASYNMSHKWAIECSVYSEGSGRFFIDSVHELQHILGLCKIDKEIRP